jgi:hypothetical protein
MKSTNDHRARTLYEEHPGSYSLYTRGNHAWICRYRGAGGSDRYVTLKTKRTDRALNIDAARAEAEVLVGAKREGKDVAPADKRRKLNDLRDIVFEDLGAMIATGERKPRTLTDYQWRYAAYLEPKLGQRKLGDLTRHDFLDLLTEYRRKGLSQ